MTIPSAAIGTPIPALELTTPVLAPGQATASLEFLLLMQKWREFVVGMNRITPCNASGTNVITLTPLDSSPLIEKYVDYEAYRFIAANSSTGSVTATIVPKTGTLATLKVYKTNGSAQAGNGDVVAGNLYDLIYADTLDSGAGGFVLK